MTSRTIHIGASLAIVLVAYWTYALLALPWIETPIRIVADRGEGGTTRLLDKPRPQDFADLFSPQDWERQNPKIIFASNDQVLLLWKTYSNHKDGSGWVDINPLTIIFVPDASVVDPTERYRHAIVMQVPAGTDEQPAASMRFDRPLDINGGGVGRLIEGRLRGQVKIRSQGKRPDHQDDLLVLTHDVELNEQRITTPNQVEFTYGPNWGRGRQMEIKLFPRSRVAGRTEYRRHRASSSRTCRTVAPGTGIRR